MKEKSKQQNTTEWGHKVLRVVKDEHFPNLIPPFQASDAIDLIKIDDLQYEYDALSMEGWRYQMGFALDDDSFYLFYKKPLDQTK